MQTPQLTTMKTGKFKTSDFGYNLPEDLIAQKPWPVRDQCRMLCLDKTSGEVQDKKFYQITDFVNSGDVLVINETKVIPARLIGTKRQSGGCAEVLLLKNITEHYIAKGIENDTNNQYWEALVKPGKRLKPGSGAIDFVDADNNVVLSASVVDWVESSQPGMRIVKLVSCDKNMSTSDALHIVGKTPLPPYIHGYKGDMSMYQTVYSKNESSAAAPTAGLHFTHELLDKLKSNGVDVATVELQVGIDTFKPVDEEDPKDHKMHSETYTISQDAIDKIEKAKAAGHNVIAVGTTSVRTLESAWDPEKCKLTPKENADTRLFILPGYNFNVVDKLITNFHVPQSTLMMLVSAFAGYENIMAAYKHAVDTKYRFLSFGDAMFIH